MKKIVLVIALALVGYSLFTLGGIKVDSSFKAKLDSLNKVNDSLIAVNLLDNKKIDELKVRDSILEYKIEHQKVRVIKIREEVAAKHNEIDTYNEQEIVSFFNNRYPSDTVTNPLPIAQPVLTLTAKDLTSFDGTKKEIVIKDSIIAIQDNRISLKDSTITLFKNKEGRYQSIIGNKDQAISEWSKQYDVLNLNYKKLQVKSKFQRIASYVIIGGLTYTLLAK